MRTLNDRYLFFFFEEIQRQEDRNRTMHIGGHHCPIILPSSSTQFISSKNSSKVIPFSVMIRA